MRARRLGARIASVTAQRADCEALLEVAKARNAETWIERIERELNEWDDELDHLISTAIDAGLEPEDIA